MRHASRRSVAVVYHATPSGPKRCSFPAGMSTRPAAILPRHARRARPRQAAASPAAAPAPRGGRTTARWLTAIGVTLVAVTLAGRMTSPHTLVVPAGGNPAVAAAAGCHAAGGKLSGLVSQRIRGGTEVLYFCEPA
jgi:hypothetical protein